jgi:hypothetical protein
MPALQKFTRRLPIQFKLFGNFLPLKVVPCMSLVVSVPEIGVRSSAAEIRATWFEVRREDLSVWNNILLDTDTSLYQYPFWNEPYRPLWLTPRYLAWGTQDQPQAFVSILTVGFGPAKIGLVFRGPTRLQAGFQFSQPAIEELLAWARKQGYIFIRFTHSDEHVLEQLAAGGRAEKFDAFPYFLDYPIQSPDYIVEQFDCDEATLASFDREARRKLRRAEEAGYEFRADDSPEALAQAWPLYQDCARRKHFRLERPLSVYQEAMQLAQAHGCVRLYSVYLNGRRVGSSLVFRDRTTAHCQLAAFESKHRHAAVFLHWHAMRDMYRMGARRYNLGPAPGSLARFKQQFCEHPVSYPGALTVVLKQGWFKVWQKAIFPVAIAIRPTLRRIVSKVKR